MGWFGGGGGGGKRVCGGSERYNERKGCEERGKGGVWKE